VLVVALGVPGGAENLRLRSFDGTPIVVDAGTLFHTLSADFFIQSDGTIYVQTGDIPAMWLRDAAAQTMPYVRFAAARPMLQTWIRAVIEREARNIIVDPYANAFTAQYRVWEHKWEVDSLSYPMLLAWAYYAGTHDRRMFSARLHRAMRSIIATYACEQQHATCSHYRYPGTATGGVPYTGMVWSAFRPSDDSLVYGFNLPQQMAALTALQDLGVLALIGYDDRELADDAAALGAGIRSGIERYGRVYHFRYGWIYAFETDGNGSTLLMDDANMPNLLSAPLFGFMRSDDPVYRATRRFALSKDNPYYFAGRDASGIGSPHTPAGYVWPLAIITRGLTALHRRATRSALLTLSQTDSEDGLIHESFDVNDYRRFTRADFGWGNAMYAELLFRSATAFGAPALWPDELAVVDRSAPRTPHAAGRLARLENTAELTSAFESAVPLRTIRIDAEDDAGD
jgi:meiotically up-regulated gene 157 (Mug157) protein